MARLVLWDVDGTLVHTSGIGAAVFDTALERVVGTAPPRRLFLSGKTDPQIAREYLELMAVDPDEHLAAVLEVLEAELAGAASLMAETGWVLPGVAELVARLAKEPDVHQTVLTGNTRANAGVKLRAFGLDHLLDLEAGAYGSDHADRRELVPIARERARRLRGVEAEPAEVWVVGDSANDLACARAGGASCLLVATGRTPYDELVALGPEAVVADLSDVDAAATTLLCGVSR